MTESRPSLPQPRTSLVSQRGARRALPRQQASWVVVQTLVAGGLAAVGVWAANPNLALAAALGAGVAVINPRRLWVSPLVIGLVLLGGLAFDAIRLPAVLGAGLVAGLAAAWLLPHVAGWLDYVNGALATAAGASLGLWAATAIVPDAASSVVGATITSALLGLVASQGLLPLAFRFDAVRLPSRRQVKSALPAAYRPAVFKAFDLYEQASSKHTPDADTRRGLCEVAHWVFRLQVTLHALDQDLDDIDPDDIAQRIAACHDDDDVDEFTRDRRRATAEHLRRLLQHRKALHQERVRTAALVDYALAFLEEARAGLAVARKLPGEAIPDRLPEVLGRLRSHAREGDARRRTAREMRQLEGASGG